jgi:hypothetical protein
MTVRSHSTMVSIDKPFKLAGADGAYPAGQYEVLTDEEAIDSMTMVAWRRIATTILLRANGVTQSVRIEPAELDALLRNDVEGHPRSAIQHQGSLQ